MVSAPVRTASTSEDVYRFDADPAASSTQSTVELVVELSQLEYAVRACQSHRARGAVAWADVDLGSLMKRKHAVHGALRSRGLNFPEVSFDRPPISEVGIEIAQNGATPHEFSGPGEVDAQARVEELQRALTTRTIIGNAVGILMERQKISADDAFDMLRAASNVTNRKLHDIAADLCETGGLPQGGPRGMV